MYRSLLIPLDGSTFAEAAIPLALSVARRAGASVQVVTVAPSSGLLDLIPPAHSSILARGWQPYLDRVVERMRTSSAVTVTSALLEGEEVAGTISAHADKVGADLVVMTTHGRGALGRFWLGSVAYELLYRSPVPLLLVKPGATAAELGQEPTCQHMLIPLDGSPLAERILEPAASFGKLMGADCTLLRVIPDIPQNDPALDGISLSSPALGLLDEIRTVQEQVRKQALSYLEGVAERLQALGLRAQTQVAVAADPGRAILDAAGVPAIDLVALETHGRRGFLNQVAGSVARKVIHGASTPVFVQSVAALRQDCS